MPKYLFITILFLLIFFSFGEKLSSYPWKKLEILSMKNKSYSSIYPISLKGGKQGFITLFPEQLKFSIFYHTNLQSEGIVDSKDIFLKTVAIDFLNFDLDGDNQDEIIYISRYPHKLFILKKENSLWKEKKTFSIQGLLKDNINSILFKKDTKEIIVILRDKHCIISMNTGKISYTENTGKLNIFFSWLHDIDKDGNDDLISLLERGEKRKKVLVYQLYKNKKFLPIKFLFEKYCQFFEIAKNEKGFQFFSLENISKNRSIVQRYTSNYSKETPYGASRSISLGKTHPNLWTNLTLGENNTIAAINSQTTTIDIYQTKNSFWEKVKSFPILQNSSKIVSHPRNKNKLLFFVPNSLSLFQSEWRDGKLSFPKIFPSSQIAPGNKLLSLIENKDKLLWIELSPTSKNTTIYSLTANNLTEEKFKLSSVRDLITQIRAIDSNFLIFCTKKSPFIYLAKKVKNKTFILYSQISKKYFNTIKQNSFKNSHFLSYLNSGSINVLNKNMQIINRISLNNEGKIISYDFISPNEIFVINSKYELLNLKKKENFSFSKKEILRKHIFANQIINKGKFPPIFANDNQLLFLEKGREMKLKLIEAFSPEIVPNYKNQNFYIHNIHPIDIDGDQKEELFLFDHYNHKISVLDIKENSIHLFNWQVFESIKHGKDPNPNYFLTLDFDGDKILDLILRSHDKMLLYLSKEK